MEEPTPDHLRREDLLHGGEVRLGNGQHEAATTGVPPDGCRVEDAADGWVPIRRVLLKEVGQLALFGDIEGGQVHARTECPQLLDGADQARLRVIIG